MKIPEYIKKIVDAQDLHTLSTSTRDGVPNIIYLKFLKVYDDERILIANNKFHKTEQNLIENPWVAFVVLDPESMNSYQLKGNVEFHQNDEIFEETLSWVKEKRPQPDIHPKSAVIVNVEEIYCGAEKI